MPTSDVAGLVWTIIMMMIPIFWLFRAGKNIPITALTALILAVALAVMWFTGRDLFIGLIVKTLGWLSLTRRFSSFSIGILRFDAILYYLSFTGFFLFLTVQDLEKRRWL
jgi:ABC-2 type transport system permease protein